MIHRRPGGKPSLALWMLVAVGDLAIIIANAGMAALIALVGLVTAAVAAVGTSVVRRAATARASVPAPVAVPVSVRRKP
jgi:hypothetical protein